MESLQGGEEEEDLVEIRVVSQDPPAMDDLRDRSVEVVSEEEKGDMVLPVEKEQPLVPRLNLVPSVFRQPEGLNYLNIEEEKKRFTVLREESRLRCSMLQKNCDFQKSFAYVHSEEFSKMKLNGETRRTNAESESLKKRSAETEENLTFHPTVTSMAAHRKERDLVTFFQSSDEWNKKRQQRLQKIRQEQEKSADVGLSWHVNPLSDEIVCRLRDDGHAGVLEGWAQRIKQHQELLAFLDNKHRPPFSPEINQRCESPTHIDDKSPPLNVEQRLYRHSVESRMRKKEAESEAVPLVASAQRTEEQIQCFLKSVDKRRNETTKKLEYKRKQFREDEATYEHNQYCPTINEKSKVLAQIFYTRNSTKSNINDETKNATSNVFKTTSNVVKTAARRSQEFAAHNERTLQRKRHVIESLRRAKEEGELLECTFSPNISRASTEFSSVPLQRSKGREEGNKPMDALVKESLDTLSAWKSLELEASSHVKESKCT